MNDRTPNSSDHVKLDVLNLKETKLSDSVHNIHMSLHLKFNNLNVKAGEKRILNDISGEFSSGELVAIMGPSGAGKSTLLNFLAGRSRGMELESGEILINNKKATKTLRRKIGYVTQEDVFFSHLTVNQTLKFIGEVRLADTYTKQEKYKIVDEVIDELALRKCVDTVMGGGLFVTGCSGGEKKRCSIATELITNPSMLMMDEPTSGLDSSTAFNLISTLKKLAKDENRTIVTTIHQPSSHVFHMFDKLMLIVDGKVAYFGETSKVLDFFEFIGTPCYTNWNPADFIMEQLTMESDMKNTIADKFIQFQRMCSNKDQKLSDGVVDHCSPNNDKKAIKCEENAKNDLSMNTQTNDDNKIERWPTGYKTQVSALCKRAFIQSRKDMVDKFTIVQTFCISFIVGLLWWDTPYDEKSLNDRQGVIFFVIVYNMLHPMFFALMTFPAERNAIAKERASGMYRLSAYYTAKVVSECPVLVIQPLIVYTISYWMSNLNQSPVFLLGMLTIITGTILSQSIGLVLGGAIKVFKKSITCAIVFAMSSMLLGGFYTKRIPHWLYWTRYVSHISYAYNILIRLEFQHATKMFSCAVESSYNNCRNNGTHITGLDILSKVTTVDVGIAESFAILWTFIIFFQTLFYLVLKYSNKST